MMPGSRLRQFGWVVSLMLCLAFFVALTFRVNAVKSEVRLAERQIVALERQKMMLETEFQTRANQQQLANWNEVEFGYAAPTAQQFLENERQLAALGAPRAANAPDPIRVASAPREDDEGGVFPAMVSPLTGQPANAAPLPDNSARSQLMAATRKEMGDFASSQNRSGSIQLPTKLGNGAIRVAIGAPRANGGGE